MSPILDTQLVHFHQIVHRLIHLYLVHLLHYWRWLEVEWKNQCCFLLVDHIIILWFLSSWKDIHVTVGDATGDRENNNYKYTRAVILTWDLWGKSRLAFLRRYGRLVSWNLSLFYIVTKTSSLLCQVRLP